MDLDEVEYLFGDLGGSDHDTFSDLEEPDEDLFSDLDNSDHDTFSNSEGSEQEAPDSPEHNEAEQMNDPMDIDIFPDDAVNNNADHAVNNIPGNMSPFHFYNERYLRGNMIEKFNYKPVDHFFTNFASCFSSKGTYQSFLDRMEDLNTSIQTKIFPETKYKLWKLIGRDRANIKTSSYCYKCKSKVGDTKQPDRDCACGACGPGKIKQPLGRFLHVSIRAQLQALLRRPGMHQSLKYRDTREKWNANNIEDIFDGQKYHELEEDFLADRNNYSFTKWVDAVQISKSSKASATAVLLQINELSPHARKRHIILGGVWIANEKPIMNDILEPVVEELNSLYRDGIRWTPAGEEERTSRFITCILSADTEGRWDILNMNRHNGLHGCTFCDANAVRRPYDDGRRGTYYYYPADAPANLRTHQSILDNMDAAHATGETVNGVKDFSEMAKIDGFDLVSGVIVDSLHCVFEGVTKRFMDNVMKKPKNNEENTPSWYIGSENHKTLIDQRLHGIKTPTRISRRTRSIRESAYWKGSEWRNFLLYYGPIVLDGVLPVREHRLFMQLSEAAFLLNKHSITVAEIDRAEALLNDFCTGFARFGNEQMVYNVHLLKHLATSVRNWGPLYTYSGFIFESWNRKIVDNVKSANDRGSQIVDRYLIAQFMEDVLLQEDLLHPDARELIKKRLQEARWDIPPEASTGKFFKSLNKIKDYIAGQEEIEMLQNLGYQVDRNTLIESFKSTLIHGARYEVRNEKIKQSCDFIVHATSGFYICEKIISFRDINNDLVEGMIVSRLRTRNHRLRPSYVRLYTQEEEIRFIPYQTVISPAMSITSDETNFIVPMPNCFETD